MDYHSIQRQLALLRAELDRIAAENRDYYKSKGHSASTKRQHERRQLRVMEIRAEIHQMLQDNAA